ncbi:MAG: ATP-dependent zinc metalloprotease FtsH [Candidatus Dormibacteria bacterium]
MDSIIDALKNAPGNIADAFSRLPETLSRTWNGTLEDIDNFEMPELSLGAMFAPFLMIMVPTLLILYGLDVHYLSPAPKGTEVSIGQVERLARSHDLESATLYQEDGYVQVGVHGFQEYAWYLRSDALTADLVNLIEANGQGPDVTVLPQTDKVVLKFLAQFLLPLLILATTFSLFFMFITGRGGGAADFLNFSKLSARIGRKKRGKGEITFNDVAAVPEALIELQEVVDYLTNPAEFAAIGARAPKGVLLAGPPGTGKTLLARAVAGEAGVPFISISGSEFVESLVGVGAARVRDLFRQARAMAPCIVFIDELDAAGRQRGTGTGQGNDEREQTLNQMLVEMDGFAVSQGIAVLGATNRPDMLDAALLRPGRFDRQVVIDVPDVNGRVEILKVHSRNRPLDPECDLLQIAKETPGFTGAELANILNEAALVAVRRRHETITQEDLEEATDRVIAGPERKSHILSDEEKRLIAIHEAGHAVVSRGVGQRVGVMKLSIVARGLQLGHTTTYATSDRMIMVRTELEARLCTMLGGLAAEILLLGEATTGNTRDLNDATELAKKMVATYGMTGELGRMQVIKEGAAFLGRDMTQMGMVSQQTLEAMDREVRNLLEDAEFRALDICRGNRGIIDQIVTLLLERETLSGPEVEPYLKTVKIPAPVVASATGGRRSRTAPTPEPGPETA